MFEWLGDGIRAVGDLAEAETALAIERFRRAGLAIVVLAFGAVLFALAFAALLGGVIVLVAPALGVAYAILCVAGGTLAVLAAGAGLIHRRAFPPSRTRRVRADVSDARARVRDALPTSSRPTGRAARRSVGERVLETVVTDPALVASGAFAVTSLLGIRRTVRVARLASTLLSAGVIARPAAQLDGSGTNTGSAASARGGAPRGSGRGVHARGATGAGRDGLDAAGPSASSAA